MQFSNNTMYVCVIFRVDLSDLQIPSYELVYFPKPIFWPDGSNFMPQQPSWILRISNIGIFWGVISGGACPPLFGKTRDFFSNDRKVHIFGPPLLSPSGGANYIPDISLVLV